MRQRVLIALGLLLEPQILILDEPTTALDILTQRQVIDLLRVLKERLGFALVFISHDLSLAAELADRVLTMYAGRDRRDRRTWRDLFYRPRHPYTLGLLHAVPRSSGALGELDSIPGSPPDLIDCRRAARYHPRCPFAARTVWRPSRRSSTSICPAHQAACIHWPRRWRASCQSLEPAVATP